MMGIKSFWSAQKLKFNFKSNLMPAHVKGLSLHVVFMLIPMLHNQKREVHGAILAELASIIDAGALKPLLDENVYNFGQVGEAYARLSSGDAVGKVVVNVAANAALPQ